MSDTIIDLIRHGEPEGGSRYRGGAIDDPLSEKGWQQMWDAVGDHAPWQRIYSSPLQRCRAFAEALGEKHSIEVQVVDSLREIGFGRWEGKTRQQVKDAFGDAYDRFYADPVGARPEDSEDLDAFVQRIDDAYSEIVSQVSGQQALIVAHAGVNRAIIARTLNAPPSGIYRIDISNGGMSRIRHKRYGPQLEFHNRRLGDN